MEVVVGLERYGLSWLRDDRTWAYLQGAGLNIICWYNFNFRGVCTNMFTQKYFQSPIWGTNVCVETINSVRQGSQSCDVCLRHRDLRCIHRKLQSVKRLRPDSIRKKSGSETSPFWTPPSFNAWTDYVLKYLLKNVDCNEWVCTTNSELDNIH